MSQNSEDIDLRDPDGFQHWVEENIRFADTDAGGHINHTSMAVYVESGRTDLLLSAMSRRSSDERWLIAHIELDYLAEAQHPGKVRVGTRLLRLGTKSVTFGAGLFLDGRCFATGQSVMVFMRGPNTAPIPEDMREVLING